MRLPKIDEQDYFYYRNPRAFASPGYQESVLKAHYKHTYHPFEPVSLCFVQNYAGIGFNKGDVIVVPAYMALFIYYAIEQENFNYNLKQAMNAGIILAEMGAILATPASGGSSLSLLALTKSLAITTIAIHSAEVETEWSRMTVTEQQNT